VYGKNKEFGTIVNFKYPAITEELVDIALKLYGSGGKSSRVIVDHYKTAVQKLALKIQEMIPTLPKPTDWALLEGDDEAKQLFLLSFRDANDQLRLVMQYYEYRWDDAFFGIDEHTWLQYVGAYKNLTFSDVNPTEEIIRPLVGKTKLSGTQVIDAHHILSLIGAKVKMDKGVQTVDSETLRIIHEEIQELSDMGEAEQAKLLKEFVDTELVPGNLSGNLSFDESFEAWKQQKVAKEVREFAADWGIDEYILSQSIDHFSVVREEVIPYVEELSRSVDFTAAKNKSAGNQLEHVITLVEKELPEWLIEMKRKYS
jgi:type I restriction enzyme R subunit